MTNVRAFLADATATMTVNGTPATSGSPVPVSLNVGSNTINVVVTAQDGTTKKTYTITVSKAASANADLAGLLISAGNLTPQFTTATISYTASVPNSTSMLEITPTLYDNTATITVNGTPATDRYPISIPLNIGSNVISVVVTAQDGTTTKTYTVTVTRGKPTNAKLAGLLLSAGTLNPAFTADSAFYTAFVSNSTSSITVTPTLADALATLSVNYSPATNGNPVSVPLKVGSNVISILITAQDGITMNEYQLKYTGLHQQSQTFLSWRSAQAR